MNPVLVLVPAFALVIGPRLWVGQVLEQHDRKEHASGRRARELARELLDKNRLQIVKVESTDIGDHYDPITRAVRLGRDKIDRKTLTALTVAAHEVAHALQDASGYGPFVWRTRLAKVAQRASEVGSVLFLAVPISAIFFRHPVPPILFGAAAVAMLGTGVIAQLAALPSELDASFGKALPMLRDGYISEHEGQDAHRILWACSLTYIASSFVAVLHIWPWIGAARMVSPIGAVPRLSSSDPPQSTRVGRTSTGALRFRAGVSGSRKRKHRSLLDTLVRPVGKPLIRLWLRVVKAT